MEKFVHTCQLVERGTIHGPMYLKPKEDTEGKKKCLKIPKE
jgi:hypothetical protein